MGRHASRSEPGRALRAGPRGPSRMVSQRSPSLSMSRPLHGLRADGGCACGPLRLGAGKRARWGRCPLSLSQPGLSQPGRIRPGRIRPGRVQLGRIPRGSSLQGRPAHSLSRSPAHFPRRAGAHAGGGACLACGHRARRLALPRKAPRAQPRHRDRARGTRREAPRQGSRRPRWAVSGRVLTSLTGMCRSAPLAATFESPNPPGLSQSRLLLSLKAPSGLLDARSWPGVIRRSGDLCARR